MDYKTKRKAKKTARRLFILAYVLMIAFGVFAIGGMILAVLMEANDEPLMSINLGIFIAVALMLLALFTGYAGQRQLNKRLSYQKYIKTYRQYNYFTKAIRLILEGGKDRFKYASRLHDLVKEDALSRFLYSFVLTASYYDGEPKDMEKGKKRMAEILSDFDPEKLVVEKITLF